MDFSSMSGWDFERYCADCLLKKGFTKAEVTSGSGDHGVDIIAEQNGIRFGIQCKLYQGQIPNKAVQEAYTGASYYDCDVAVIMSNSELTKQAQEEARKLRVKFWSINDYASKDEKTVLPSESIETRRFEPNIMEWPKVSAENYDEYAQKIIEYTTSAGTITDEENANSSKTENFGDAIKWLNIQNQSWYTLTRSMNAYLDVTEKINNSDHVDLDFLSEKLCYFDCLANALSTTGTHLRRSVQTKCEDFEKNITNESCSIDNKYLSANPKFWEINFFVEQSQSIFEILKRVIESVTDSEYDKMQPIVSAYCIDYISCTYALNPTAVKRIREYGKSYESVLYWWKCQINFEEWLSFNCSYWKKSRTFFNLLQSHRRIVKKFDPDMSFEQRLGQKTITPKELFGSV